MSSANQAVPDDLANQDPEAISAMFGRVAPRYDLMNHAMGAGIDIYWRWKLARAVRAQRPARILDLATGSGDVLLALHKQRAFTELAAGADFCLPMLRLARSKKAVNLLASDGLRLPFPAAAFDAVTIAFGLRNFADRLAGLREMRRVLRPGGRAYILEFSHPVAWLAPAYFWYMRAIMPKYSRLFTPEEGAYKYLGESIKAFLPQPKLAGMMVEAGFSKADWTNFALGIVALHVAEV
ncbi:MAG TPA: ubiquinone/menaquinone biosynthesis methyltransferase [Candidatus Methylacidiphilales bacterium]|nr:ubiquinone/menaquinone biosynthesis methyltransferase [Candidatus Methylacidiphilales bacterium]